MCYRPLILGALFVMSIVIVASDIRAAEPAGFTIPRSEVVDITSDETGEDFRILIWRPVGEAPPEGYPVVYLLDANGSFGTAVNIVDLRSRAPQSTGMVPAVVVGIAYPTDAPYHLRRRTYDLTPPSSEMTLPPRPNGKPWPPTGGADVFLRFIQNRVKPMVADRVPVDTTRETLIGHSFGGLFSLHVMMSQPAAFDTYVAGSPSIWFNDRFLLGNVDRLLAQDLESDIRVYMSVGDLEETVTAADLAGPSPEKRRAWKLGNRMVGNARDMAKKLSGHPQIELRFEVYADESHASSIPLYLSRGLAFALGL